MRTNYVGRRPFWARRGYASSLTAGAFSLVLSFLAGVSAPLHPAMATVQLTGWEVGQGTTPTSTSTTAAPLTPFGASNPPAIYHETIPGPDTVSDSVGATVGTFRVNESGAATYSVPIYVAPGTAGLVPTLSLDYNSRGGSGPMGPNWSVGGLSALTRCLKASEYGDGTGPFPPINFDADTSNDAYCLDGARLLTLASATSCPAGPAGSTATAYGLETDTTTRVCGYTKVGITGPAFWLVQPKDGTSRRYGVAGNSALVHNDGQGNADPTQLLSWSLDRIADASGNVIEFVYTQTSSFGELTLSEVDYTGKVAQGTALTATTFTRAPYNKVTLTYGTLPAASQRVDYLSGMKLSLTQQLTTVTAQGTTNNGATPDALQTVRVYHLNYATPTASGVSSLDTLQECVPNGGGEVCYPRTRFTWNGGNATTAKGFPNAPTSAAYAGRLDYAIDTKSGDVNGDGRQDLIWLKDGACDSSGSGSTRFQVMVSLTTSTGFAAPIATGVYLTRPPTSTQGSLPGCSGNLIPNHFETISVPYDFTGDGRDDLLALNSAGNAWVVYPAVANAGGGWKFDSANPVATGVPATAEEDGKLLDLNADGLPDLLHASNARFLRRASSGALTFSFEATDTAVDLDEPPVSDAPPGFVFDSYNYNTTRQGVPAVGDLDGDGAADLTVKAFFAGGDPGCPIRTIAPLVRTLSASVSEPQAVNCKSRWYTYRNLGVQANGHVRFGVDTSLGPIGGTGELLGTASDMMLADVNGDGQADLVYHRSGGAYYLRLNAGKADNNATSSRFLPEQPIGLTLSGAQADQLQFLDVNGDHKADLFYPVSSGGQYPLKARLFGVSGFGAEIDVGNATSNAQDINTTVSFVLDVTGDGPPDLVRYASGTLKVATNALKLGGNDAITGIVNGLGNVSGIAYSPLTYSSAYTRALDGPSKIWGRGAPVFDEFSALWVVRAAWQSTPTGADALAVSDVFYRYGGARMQSGGRGFLGFQTVQTEDLQNLILTTTEYRQDFPYTGRPLHTTVEKESEPLPDPCLVDPNANGCFKEPPDRCNPTCPRPAAASTTPILLSDAANTWTTTPAFPPATPQPVLPYMSASNEQKFDLASGAFSSGVSSTFVMDSNGNVTSSTVATSHGDTLGTITDETKTTTNIFGCKASISPPTTALCTGGNLDAELQRLGRLSVSTETSSRPGQSTNSRRSSFEYDATTRLLISEIQGPYDFSGVTDEQKKRWGLRTDYVLDADGNRSQENVCSTWHFANRTACLNLSGFQQRQWPTDLTKIQRYRKWEYEPKGRFVLDSKVPFYNAGASNNTDENYADYEGVALAAAPAQRPSSVSLAGVSSLSLVVYRTPFGAPFNRISSAGMSSDFAYGVMGRAYFSETTVGTFERTTYRWCQDVNNADVPGTNRVNCPTGAIFRVAVDSVASTGQVGAGGIAASASVSPTGYSYIDVSGREILKTTRVYQQDTASLDRWSSIATTYDNTGRTKTTTVPYFSADPTLAQTAGRAGTPRSGTPAIAQTDYDAVNRATTLTIPEMPVNGTSTSTLTYDKLDTDVKNPRNFHAKQTKNGRGEAIKAVDDANFTVNYTRDAVGNVLSVTRTPNDGDSAGVMITTGMQYDRLGRRTGISDPDKGSWTYEYNALGELTKQTDAKGQTQEVYRDALGRLIQRLETRASGGTFISEPASSWEYDTDKRDGAMGGGVDTAILGTLHVESNGLGGFSRTIHSDDVGRISSVVTSLEGIAYTDRQTYDAVGRAFQHFDPTTDTSSSNGELVEYSSDGFPIRTREANNGTSGQIYNEMLAMTQRGQVKQEKFHNSAALTTTRTYDDNTGRMLVLSTGSAGALQFWDYGYDKHTNLASRRNHATGFDLTETFTYDDLDRLKTITPSGGAAALTVGYDQLGNLKSKTNGTTTYNWTYAGSVSGCARTNAGRHAVSAMGGASFCYDENGNQITATYVGGSTRQITYTGYDLPESITTNGYPTSTTQSYKYAPDRGMWKRVDGAVPSVAPNCPAASDRLFCDGFEQRVGGSPGATTYFVGNLEVRTSGSTTTTKRYVGGYLVITTTNTNTTPQYDYLLRDALGSLDVIASETGSVRQRQSFDAWGQRRTVQPGSTDYFAWLLSPASAATFDTSSTYQGYTGHQQLDAVGLVHMKGRLYDPALGRFIQADPFTERDVTQGLNRYSYVLNNPLSAFDPSGYSLLSFAKSHTLGVFGNQIWGSTYGRMAIAIVAAYFTFGAAYAWAAEAGYSAFTAGAIAGASAGFVSGAIQTGTARGALIGAFGGAISGGIASAYGNSFAAQVGGKALAGGVTSELSGGNFGHGFVAAGVTGALSPAIEQMPTPAYLMASAVIGGTVSEATGGSFKSGAFSGAFSAIFDRVVSQHGRIEEAGSEKFEAEKAYGDPSEVTRNDDWADSGAIRVEWDSPTHANLDISVSIIPMDDYRGQFVPMVMHGIEWWAGDYTDGMFSYTVNISVGLFPAPGGILRLTQSYLDRVPPQFGAAAVQGRGVILAWTDAFNGPALWAHEFGHVLGLSHSGTFGQGIMSYSRSQHVQGWEVGALVRKYGR